MGRDFFDRSGRFVRRLGLRSGLQASYLLARRAVSRDIRPRQLRLPGLAHPIWLRGTTSDIEALEQVFVHAQYDSSHWPEHHAAIERTYAQLLADGKTPTIIDCGANIGCASLWFARKYPRAIVYAIEPELQNVTMLERNVAGCDNIVPIAAGVSDRAARLTLQNHDGASWAWQTVEDARGTVEAVTIDSVLARRPGCAPFIVKVDIEGHEAQLFHSNAEWAAATPLIVFEMHDWLFPWRGTGHAIFRCLTQRPRDFLMRGETIFSFAHAGEGERGSGEVR
jgi:FkbM family methyltransferase